MPREKITNAEMLQALEELANDLGKAPHQLTRRDVDNSGTVSSPTYTRAFGSWNDAKNAFEVYYNKRQLYFLNKKNRDMDMDEVFDFCEKSQKVVGKSKLAQYDAHIKIKTKDPIIIVFAACFHMGSLFTDYDSLREAIKFMIDTPNLYMGLCGDMIDQFMFNFRDKSVPHSQILSPQHQALLLQKILHDWDKKEKILWKVFGNHERYLERISGTSLGELILSNTNRSPFMPDGGLITLEVGKTVYTLFVKHKARFKSSVNPLHQPAQVARYIQSADVVCTSHEHNPAIGMIHDKGEKIVLIRTGSYKIDDSFSMRFFRPGVIGLPSIVLFPDEKKIVIFDDPHDAKIYRDSISKRRGVK